MLLTKAYIGRVHKVSNKIACITDGHGSSPEPPLRLADTSADMWIKMAKLPCWPLHSQQVLNQRWIWGIHCVQTRKQASEEIYPGFETQGRRHQKSKTGVSVAPQKGLQKFYLKKSQQQNCLQQEVFLIITLMPCIQIGMRTKVPGNFFFPHDQ